jgi:hypothetical protein
MVRLDRHYTSHLSNLFEYLHGAQIRTDSGTNLVQCLIDGVDNLVDSGVRVRRLPNVESARTSDRKEGERN